MMLNRRGFIASAAAVAAIPSTSAFAQTSKPVVATFSILADMVERVGGDRLAITSLVGRNGDAHVYQPTPDAARAVSEAELLFVNGLSFEGWLDRLIDASDFQGVRVVATEAIEPILAGQGRLPEREGAEEDHHGHDEDHHDHDEDHHHDEAHHDDEDHDENEAHHDEGGHHHHDHGAYDPHAWLSLANAKLYVETIANALSAADPEHAEQYVANQAAYAAEIDTLDSEVREILGAIPEEKRVVVTSHNAFQYFARDYGLTFLAPQGLSTEAEAAAKDVAHLIEQMRERGVQAVFLENISDPRLLEQIARETGATIGGTLYPGALSEISGPAPTYLDLMRHNARTIATALNS